MKIPSYCPRRTPARFVSLGLLGVLTVTARAPAVEPPVSSVAPIVLVDEILAYACARDVTGLVRPAGQVGPLFREGELVFWSLTDADHKPRLAVDAGTGVYSIELARLGINRLRFELPTVRSEERRTYFLSYLHDTLIRSRYLEFAVGAPPVGHFDLDYLTVIPRRAPNLRPHLEYAIFETSRNLFDAALARRLGRDKLTREIVRNCDHLARENPRLAKQLRQNIEGIDGIALGPAERLPAGQLGVHDEL